MGDVVLSHPAGAHVRNLKGSNADASKLLQALMAEEAHESQSFIAPASESSGADIDSVDKIDLADTPPNIGGLFRIGPAISSSTDSLSPNRSIRQ